MSLLRISDYFKLSKTKFKRKSFTFENPVHSIQNEINKYKCAFWRYIFSKHIYLASHCETIQKNNYNSEINAMHDKNKFTIK